MIRPSLAWHQAILFRRSRRSFHPRTVEPAKLDRIERLCLDFRPYPASRAVLVRRPPEEVFRGLIGSTGSVSGAGLYLAFIGEEGKAGTEEGIGYTGEGVILEATLLGLGTCWVSGFFRASAVRSHLEMGPGEKVYAVSPLGYAERERTVKDRIYSVLAGSKRRKPLSELVSGSVPEPWQTSALEAARLAPSATNRQPWRFVLAPGSITIRTDSPRDVGKYPKRLDCGIAMLHVELGALAAGVTGTWALLPAPEVARFEVRSGPA
jgi:nitroreductase